MENIVVGDENCSFTSVWRGFKYSTSFATVVQTWPDLARELEMAPEKIMELRQAVQLDKMNASDVLYYLLFDWRERRAKQATLQELLKILARLGWNDVKERLEQEFNLTTGHTEVKANFKETIPPPLPYYVPRTLCTRSRLQKEIFKASKNDIFVFRGIERHQLTLLFPGKSTDSSSSQVMKLNITVSFITLDQKRHWQRLCRISRHPIHLIQCDLDNQLFTWIESDGDITLLQKFVDSKQVLHTEQAFINLIEDAKNRNTKQPVCISDTPGMGKSVLLSQIGRMLKKADSAKIVLFIEMGEWITDVSEAIRNNSDKRQCIVNWVVERSCQDDKAKNLLRSHFSTDTSLSKIEFLLDGFDEVNSDNMGLALECLSILKSAVNSRIWVTTRPHMLENLEKHFGILGYNIQAFTTADQLSCLEAFWQLRKVEIDKSRLRKFTEECLESVKAQLNTKDEDIAGIPLQCMLIAEVYEQDAIDFSESDSESPCLTINITSVIDLYELLCAKKFTKFITTTQWAECAIGSRQLKSAHMISAIGLLFPRWEKSFMSQLLPDHDTYYAHLLNVGLMETSSNSEVLRFIHRTFAEFFVAWFIIDSLQSNLTNNLGRFLLNDVLCVKEESFRESDFRTSSFLLEHNNICYFFNYLLRKQSSPPSSNVCFNYVGHKFLIYNIARACARMGLYHVLKFFHEQRPVHTYGMKFVGKDYLVDAVRASSVDVLQLLIESYKDTLEQELCETITDDLFRILYLATEKGDYSVLECVLKQDIFLKLVEGNLETTDRLITSIISNTINCKEWEIKQRTSMLNLLFGLNANLFSEHKECRCTSQKVKVHETLLFEMVKMNNPMILKNWDRHNILHFAATSPSVSVNGFDNLLMSVSPQNLKILVEEEGDKIMYEYVRNKVPTLESLNTLQKFGASVNAKNSSYQDTPLHDAVFSHGDQTRLSVVRTLMECGADANAKNKNSETPFDIALKHKLQHELVIFLLKAMDVCQRDKNGHTVIYRLLDKHPPTPTLFHDLVKFLIETDIIDLLLDKSDKISTTPLHLAVRNIDVLECTLTLLHLNGATFDAIDNSGFSVLHCAVQGGRNVNILKKMMRLGAVITKAGSETVTHMAASSGNLHALKYFLNELGLKEFNQPDLNWNTPLHRILLAEEQEKSAIIMLLLETGADVNIQNKNGDSPIDLILLKDGEGNRLKLLLGKNGSTAVDYLLSKKISTHVEFKAMVKEIFETCPNSVLQNEITSPAQSKNCYYPLLHFALRRIEVDKETLDYLHTHGVDFRAVDKFGNSMLYSAAKGGRSLSCLKKLTKLGADWKILNNFNQGIFHAIATQGQVAALRFFMKMQEFGKSNINLADKFGNSPLHCAMLATSGIDDGVVVILLRAGADITMENIEGDTAFDIGLRDSTFQNRLPSILVSTFQDRIEGKMIFHYSLLRYIFTPEVFHLFVEALIETGNSDVLLVNGHEVKTTPLHFALFRTEVQPFTLHLLNSRGIKFDAQDTLGNSVLYYAIRGLRTKRLLETMIHLGASVTDLTETKMNALHASCLSGNLMALTYFLTGHYVGNVNDKDSNGYTSLHCAMHSKSGELPEIVQLLIQAGADPCLISRYGYTPLDLALINGVFEVTWPELRGNSEDIGFESYLSENVLTPSDFHQFVTGLISTGIEGVFQGTNLNVNFTVLHLAVSKFDIADETLEALNSYGVDLNRVGRLENPLIVFAIRFERSLSFLRKLIELKADWTLVDYHNSSVLTQSCSFGQLATLQFFLELGGCDINGADNDGDTPLHCAVLDAETNIYEMTKLLVESGADKSVKNHKGETAYECAVRKDLEERIRDLLKP